MSYSSIFLFLQCLAIVSVATRAQTPGSTRPNFLFVISDDLRYIDPYNDPLQVMQNIGSIVKAQSPTARGGAFFTNAHAQMAMCSPSRCSFLTGLRSDTTGLYQIHQRMRGAKVPVTTISEALRKNGYKTVAVGKIFDGRSAGGPNVQDFPRSWSIPVQTTKAAVWSRNTSMPDCGYGDTPFRPKTNMKPVTQCVTSNRKDQLRLNGLPDEDLLSIAIEELSDLSANADEKPFFLAVGFLRTHLPLVAPRNHFARWPRSSFLNHTQYPYWISRDDIYQPIIYRNSEVKTFTDWYVPTDPSSFRVSMDTHARMVHSYLACASFVDDLFGRLIAALDSQPASVKDNTVIFFFADHGFHLNDHLFWGKKTVYEKATRVPLLVLGPKSLFPTDSILRIGAPVELIDLAPTIFELAGLNPPTNRGFQGASLLAFTKQANRVQRTKTVALSQFPGFGMFGSNIMSYSFRGLRYRMIFHYHLLRAFVVKTELYDYQMDPLEKHDVSDSKAYADVSQQFYSLFKLYRDSLADYNNKTKTVLVDLEI